MNVEFDKVTKKSLQYLQSQSTSGRATAVVREIVRKMERFCKIQDEADKRGRYLRLVEVNDEGEESCVDSRLDFRV